MHSVTDRQTDRQTDNITARADHCNLFISYIHMFFHWHYSYELHKIILHLITLKARARARTWLQVHVRSVSEALETSWSVCNCALTVTLWLPSPSVTTKLTGLATPDFEQSAVMKTSLMSRSFSSVVDASVKFPVISFTRATNKPRMRTRV